MRLNPTAVALEHGSGSGRAPFEAPRAASTCSKSPLVTPVRSEAEAAQHAARQGWSPFVDAACCQTHLQTGCCPDTNAHYEAGGAYVCGRHMGAHMWLPVFDACSRQLSSSCCFQTAHDAAAHSQHAPAVSLRDDLRMYLPELLPKFIALFEGAARQDGYEQASRLLAPHQRARFGCCTGGPMVCKQPSCLFNRRITCSAGLHLSG